MESYNQPEGDWGFQRFCYFLRIGADAASSSPYDFKCLADAFLCPTCASSSMAVGVSPPRGSVA